MFVDTCFAEISAVNREFISKKYCTHTGSTTDGQTNIHISCGLLEDERAGGPSDRSCRPPSFFLGLPRISGTTRDRSVVPVAHSGQLWEPGRRDSCATVDGRGSRVPSNLGESEGFYSFAI